MIAARGPACVATFGLAQGQWNNGFAVGGSVSRGDYRTRTTREVPLLGQTLYSRQDSDVTIAQVEGSWTWTHGRTQLQPYVQFTKHWVDSDRAVEQGGSAALVLEGGKDTLNVSTVGVRGRWDVAAASASRRSSRSAWAGSTPRVTPMWPAATASRWAATPSMSTAR